MTATPFIHKQYVEWRENGYWIKDSRVYLDSVVYAFLNGTSPESIIQSFPVLKLEQVYGAITFYLANQSAIDAYLQAGEAEFEKLRQASKEQNAALYNKLLAAKGDHQ
ncbi:MULTISPECIES: DUF433 domain-containing protein [unclassified Tolypothrix]|uniref:DUF433 domain-containing protein n=1 Tax=unclassified Tolypothrix TaxID=2649714 RepID=UPI0005EAC69E|nr:MULTISPECIES: DUF433 domain-containing protein [unclassified Tolypothrix]BAY90253.1 hypothetical protein NIES3275_22650 [Microchaete diplosiphon NIES-3275]EKF01695.1 hypothetical protein FDUTEX481_07566 [Tolypothrix sp. PCC 7601]MBE9085048.1 DUF433 domain-containing protein [Tolypothrix sp. LEGE 11397]UYD24447.1 DUF433 domain-containing protein [Tolypothrix sp. PCC 7712]UYD33321.1 DUF433 domain-containing protein [Tolypothrix sp. PCC 7601]